MKLPRPKAPPYDLGSWRQAGWNEKTRMACEGWAIHGYGAPMAVYALYMVKVVLYITGWMALCYDPGQDVFWDFTWCFTTTAFQKAILWSMLYEGLGLGCGSGPLTGRYIPPLGGFLYFARPGTTKAPAFPRTPLIG